MRRKLEKKPRAKALKSLSDRTRSGISETSTSTSPATCKMRPSYPKDEVRLSEFTSITCTTSLSDDDDDDDDDVSDEDVSDDDATTTLERKRDPSSKKKPRTRRCTEDDAFGTLLSKIMDHFMIASSSSSFSSSSSSGRKLPSKLDSSNNLGNDGTAEHRSNYSKRRLSIQVRRASDFLFSSHHRDSEKDDEEAEQHQWKINVEDTGVDGDANGWEL